MKCLTYGPKKYFCATQHLSNLLNKIGIQIAAISYKLPDKIITVSKTAEKYIIQHYNPKPPVHGIPVGVDLSTFRNVTRTTLEFNL